MVIVSNYNVDGYRDILFHLIFFPRKNWVELSSEARRRRRSANRGFGASAECSKYFADAGWPRALYNDFVYYACIKLISATTTLILCSFIIVHEWYH